tara:strand:+ start:1935 stop:3008 length:1074 start_codon:yes stop_codon:yes gene_type:complete
MNTYIKFLIRTYLFSFLNVFIIAFSLILILNLLTELDFFKNENVSTYFPLYLSILNVPSLVFEMFPFIFLISTQLFFHNLFNYNQINTLKYSGLKNSKILIIINSLTFILGIIIIIFFYNFSSNFKKFYLELKTTYTQDNKYLAVITNNGLWIKDIIDNKTLLINASKIEQNIITNVYLSEFTNNFEIIRNIKSKKVDIKNKKWIIYDAEIFKQNYKTQEKQLELDTNFDYEIIQNLFSNLSSLSLFDLVEMRKKYISLNYSITELNLHILNLFLYPFYLVLMTLISSIIMFNSKNFKNKYLKIIVGLFASVSIYYIFNYFYVLGITEKINWIASIMSPLLILLTINYYFLRNINEK